MDEIYGYIERITFYNSENGYTVAHLKEPSCQNSTCIVGILPTVQIGETIRCKGTWKRHLIHGSQFSVESYRVEAPADIIGIKKYLGSGLIKGIGAAYAEKIVEKFGTQTLDIIDKEPDKLGEVDGIGAKRLESIKQCWQEHRSIRDLMIFLQSHQVSSSLAQKIYKVYGNRSIEIVQKSPYSLARDVFGIGFKTADALAEKLGIGKDNQERIEAGIEFVLHQLSEEGHVCYPLSDFNELAKNILENEPNLIDERVTFLKSEERIVVSDQVYEGKLTPFIWLKKLFVSEAGIGREIKRLRLQSCSLRKVDVQKAIEWVQNLQKIKLADNQREAVAISITEKMHIITGGPGTGKSTITKAILAITEKLTPHICLCAPTGRAAKRMQEITGRKASTIHSLLEYDFKKLKFKKDKDNPIECDLIIIDEASMIDTYLMYNLLKAIPDHARVILVGDINQLPSVGPGNVLKDIIQSRCLPVTTLNEIFRQAAGSRIITNAHKINKGHMPDIENHSDSDFFFMEIPDPEDILKNIIALVLQRLPKKFGFDPLKEIQVLAPMKKGIIGTENLNQALQLALNRDGTPLFKGGKKFIVGDKVMQLKNDYKREVYNGDIGYITHINHTEQQLMVQIDEREVVYEFRDLDELVLAYAVSIHKYQGSECPCIVLPVHTTHFKLLHRNLLYTGVTRGKQRVIIVGTAKALSIAVRNDEIKKRHTGLLAALLDYNTVSLEALRSA